MIKILRALALLAAFALPLAAHAQSFSGKLHSGNVQGNPSASEAPGTDATVTSILDRAMGSTAGEILLRGASTWSGVAPSGDCALSSAGALTCTKTSGTAFGSLATASPGTGLALSGTTLNLQPPTLSVIGGVKAINSVSHQWISAISTAGVPSLTQPAFADLSGTPTTLSGYGITSPLPVAQGGTACATASGTCLDNIAGFASTGFLTRTGAGTYAFQSATNGVTFGNLAQGSGLSVLGVTGASAANLASIAGTANQALVVNSAGTALAFGQLNLGSSAAITGTLLAAQEPAHTGDVTNTAGSLALTLASSISNAHFWTGLATFSNGASVSNGLTVLEDSSSAQQLVVQGLTNTNQQISLGYNTSSNYGDIQAVLSGLGFEPLLLNPSGGNVGVHTTAPSAGLDVRSSLLIANTDWVTGSAGSGIKTTFGASSGTTFTQMQAFTLGAAGAGVLELNPLGGQVTADGNPVVTATGGPTSTTCASWTSATTLGSTGVPCGTGGTGSGTVTSGSANQLAYYPGAGTSVSGLATANNGILTTNSSGVPSISTTLPPGVSSPTAENITANSYPNVSDSLQTTTGTISSTTLTLASALDFANGQGIRINHAGAAVTLAAVTGYVQTCTGGSGATAYQYEIIPIDANGGYGTAAAGSGNCAATLSASVYSGLSWNASPGAVGYAVWGRKSGSINFLALVAGTTYNDIGNAFHVPPDWISTYSASAHADWLVTSIVSGGGTTTLTLAGGATTSGSGKDVYHDDTVALQSAWNAASSTGRGLYLNAGGGYRISSPLTCNSGTCVMSGAGRFSGSAIYLSSPTQDGLQLGAVNPNLGNFQILGNDGDGFNIAGSLISSYTYANGETITLMAMSYGSTCFLTDKATVYFVGNTVACSSYDIYTTEPGDSIWTNNDIDPFAIPGSTLGVGMFVNGDPGGIKVIGNKFNSAIGGYAAGISIDVTSPDGDIMIVGNSIEGWNSYGILIANSGGTAFGNINITSNQIASGVSGGFGVYVVANSGGSGVWMSDLSIVGNSIYSALYGIFLSDSSNYVVEGNNIDAATTGIYLDTNNTRCMIGTNVFSGTVTTKITDASAACTYAAITATKPAYP